MTVFFSWIIIGAILLAPIFVHIYRSVRHKNSEPHQLIETTVPVVPEQRMMSAVVDTFLVALVVSVLQRLLLLFISTQMLYSWMFFGTLMLVVHWVYCTTLWSTWGCTPGLWITTGDDISVRIRTRTHAKIHFIHANLRYVCEAIDLLTGYIGYFFVYQKNRQSLGDRLSKTRLYIYKIH